MLVCPLLSIAIESLTTVAPTFLTRLPAGARPLIDHGISLQIKEEPGSRAV